ncbi:hypothetical protein L596_022649 [Steinernema carpocapsae]|uniref:Uncharacterized protein n=1 Tax=Steinernema carpocapsae TaxID=34508 RepID=A0A4U5MMC6_STECR|nr:hypothetical protein L596_022649 [Steinernema carpocapsae]
MTTCLRLLSLSSLMLIFGQSALGCFPSKSNDMPTLTTTTPPTTCMNVQNAGYDIGFVHDVSQEGEAQLMTQKRIEEFTNKFTMGSGPKEARFASRLYKSQEKDDKTSKNGKGNKPKNLAASPHSAISFAKHTTHDGFAKDLHDAFAQIPRAEKDKEPQQRLHDLIASHLMNEWKAGLPNRSVPVKKALIIFMVHKQEDEIDISAFRNEGIRPYVVQYSSATKNFRHHGDAFTDNRPASVFWAEDTTEDHMKPIMDKIYEDFMAWDGCWKDK